VQPRRGQRLVQCGPIGILAALDFRMLFNDPPVAAIEVSFDGRALRFKA